MCPKKCSLRLFLISRGKVATSFLSSQFIVFFSFSLFVLNVWMSPLFIKGYLTWLDLKSATFLCNFLKDLTCQKSLKSVSFWQSYSKHKRWTFWDTVHRERKCAENYNKWHNKVIFLTAISILVISNHDSFRLLFGKIASVCLIWKIYIYILALEMAASPKNQHCASSIGTLSFPIGRSGVTKSMVTIRSPFCGHNTI